MNSLFETIKKYGDGKGEQMMWKSVELISDAIDAHMDEEDKERLTSELYGLMSGWHYNEEYATKCVSRMFYVNKSGMKHYAPYWTDEQIRGIYNSVKGRIPGYNEWDFYVTFNMIASDYWTTYHEWWPDITPELFAQKVTEATLAWLADPDWEGEAKIWRYMHM